MYFQAHSCQNVALFTFSIFRLDFNNADMLLLLPFLSLLLACQPQLTQGGMLDSITKMILGSEPLEAASKHLPDIHRQEEPTFPPGEQFCTNQDCLSEDLSTQISPTSSVHLNKYTTTRPHPAVVKFKGQKSESVAAKFRSLSMRNLAIYWDDGAEGIFQGILKPGQTTQSNSYSGHRFFFTQENDKTNVIGMVTVDKNKILNVIRDGDFPLADTHPVMAHTLREEAYDREYMAKNDGLR